MSHVICEILSKLEGYFDYIYAASIDYERSFSVSELIELCKQEGIDAAPLEQPGEYVENFIATRNNECLVILGSIYLLGDIKKKLSGKMT